MNLTTIACTTLLLVGSTSQPGSPSAEAVTLAWKLPAGADYLIESTSTVDTTTVTMDQEQSEFMQLETTHRVHVNEVTEDGDMELTITVESYFMGKESPQLNIELSCERDDDGEIRVAAEIDSELAELEGSDVTDLFEAIGRNNMELEFTVLLTPTGEVESSSLKGDPMHDLPTDTEVTEMIAATASALLDAEDLPGLLTSQIFSLLPAEPVEVGAEWDVSRHYDAMGLEMDGKGRCTLDELKTEDGVQLAVITEDMLYSVGAEGLEENMIDMMTVIFESTGMELEVAVELDAEDTNTSMETHFDIAAGFHRSMVWSETTATVNGVMTIAGNEMDMVVETVASGRSSWSRLEEK